MPELDSDGLWKDDPGAITTWTRRRVNPLTMTSADVDIRDIAHALARQCRYNGHVEAFLSVARHSINVAERLPKGLQLAGLLHDAAEAYLGDLPRPLKHGEFGRAYLEAEAHVERAVFAAFGLPATVPHEVQLADRAVLMQLEMPEGGHRWSHAFDYRVNVDERQFLDLFERYATPCIVGITGYAQAGKDTAAQVLVEQFGFQRIAFADALRDMLYALNPLATLQRPTTFADGAEWWSGEIVRPVQDWVDERGWEWAKANTTCRQLLQRLGTEAGRQVLGSDIWVRTALEKINPGGRYVFTDVRFPNEADAIEEAGGQLWRIERRGTEPVNAHPSETALDGRAVRETILNTGDDLAGFQRLVHSIAFHKLGLVSVGS